MFGLMLSSTHRAVLAEMAKKEAKHQKSIDDTLATLRSQLATADSRGQAMADKLAEANAALATCRNHAETLTAQITANEPFVAAGKAAKAMANVKPARGTTAKASAARSAPEKSNAKAK